MRHRVFRDSTHVIETRHRRRWPWAVGGVLAVIALLAIGQARDDKVASPPLTPELQELSVNADQEAMLHAAFELGRSKGHAEMLDSARAAWDSAQAEADRCRAKGGAL